MMFSSLIIIIIINYFAINLFSVCNAKVEIQSLFVPKFVENGTEDSIILDCLYTLDPIDDRNLVVKWFLNDDPEPIYQWIPELKARHASKRLQGRINMDFTVNTADPLTQYRALNILRPTIDLSGKYSCHVLSLSSQDFEEETMIIYATPKSFDFNYTRTKDREKESQLALRTRKGTNQWEYKSSSHSALGSTSPDAQFGDYSQHQHLQQQQQQSQQQQREALSEWQPTSATLSCHVSDVFPVPEMTIYRISDDGSQTQVLTEIEQKVDRNPNGAYNVTISSDIRDNQLIQTYGSHKNNYECLLLLPDGSKNNYQRKKRITYLTEYALLNTSCLPKDSFKLITILFTILLFYGSKYS